jgi:hypothetical protein
MAKGAAKAAAKTPAKRGKKEASTTVAPVLKSAQKEKAEKKKDVEGLAAALEATTMTHDEWKAHQVGMQEKWPQPDYMKEPWDKGQTSYREQTFSLVTRFMVETRILYRPHAKRPGTKSHVRYENYSKGQTVGQSFELGSWPVDWCWDIERGYIKVLGPLRDEPIDITMLPNDATPTAVDKAVYGWYRKELAKKLGLSLEDLKGSALYSESTLMRAHRLVAQREAKQILAKGTKISDQDILKVLQEWSFARNVTRVNVMPDGSNWVWSDTLGLLRDRTGDIHLTRPTLNYPEVSQVINRWLVDRLPADIGEFSFTTLNLNKNYNASIHRDGNNFGPSMISAFGDFSGGALNYYPDDDCKTDPKEVEKTYSKPVEKLDLKDGLAMFNGNNCHSVDAFKGERFSVVYFTLGCHAKMSTEAREQLESMDFKAPSIDADPTIYLKPPASFERKAQYRAVASPLRSAAQTTSQPSFRYWAKSALNAELGDMEIEG